MTTPARLSQETVPLATCWKSKRTVRTAADKASLLTKKYGVSQFWPWLSKRRMSPYIPVPDRKQQMDGFYTQCEFTHVPEENATALSEGELPRYIGMTRGSQDVRR